MASKLVLLLLLSLLSYAAVAQQPCSQAHDARQCQVRQCQLSRMTKSRPNERIESEGGVTEIWDPQQEDEFQCAGVAAVRNRIRPNAMTLPKFFPAPKLIYIEQGRGVFGMSCPGCPETYHSGQQPSRGSQPGKISGDLHQRLHRVRRGDIIAVPRGTAHWCYNDGNEELVAVSVLDLGNGANQLGQSLRAFMLAGGQPNKQSQPQKCQESPCIEETFQNVFRPFDAELMAEAFNVPSNIIRRMQHDDNRGLIVQCQGDMSMLTPDDEPEEYEKWGPMQHNGLEETVCNKKVKYNIELQNEADVYTRRAGRINLANEQKLPILREMDMSAERGRLMPNALHTPNWDLADHRVVYCLNGDLQVQVADDNGDTIMNERIQRGEMFVVPQFYIFVARAGNNGCEYVSFKTSSQPMKNPLAGYTSVMRAMPIDVLATAYQMSSRDAQQVKKNRDPQTMLLTPLRSSSWDLKSSILSNLKA